VSDVQPESLRPPRPLAPVGDAGDRPDDAELDRSDRVVVAVRPPRAGELSTPWRVVMVVTWVAVFVAFMAVWKASEEIGIATWWLGPRSNPQPMPVRLVPFVLAVVFAVLASYNVRRFPWVSLGGSIVLAAIAAADLTRSTGLALIEFAIAAAVALISLAATTGMYRRARPDR
jgi:hypothetical protein